jgi:hypothetical protein
MDMPRMMAAPYNYDFDHRVKDAHEAAHEALGRYLGAQTEANELALIGAYNDVNIAIESREAYYRKLDELEASRVDIVFTIAPTA